MIVNKRLSLFRNIGVLVLIYTLKTLSYTLVRLYLWNSIQNFLQNIPCRKFQAKANKDEYGKGFFQKIRKINSQPVLLLLMIMLEMAQARKDLFN
jgi:hypothetical protein